MENSLWFRTRTSIPIVRRLDPFHHWQCNGQEVPLSAWETFGKTAFDLLRSTQKISLLLSWQHYTCTWPPQHNAVEVFVARWDPLDRPGHTPNSSFAALAAPAVKIAFPAKIKKHTTTPTTTKEIHQPWDQKEGPTRNRTGVARTVQARLVKDEGSEPEVITATL